MSGQRPRGAWPRAPALTVTTRQTARFSVNARAGQKQSRNRHNLTLFADGDLLVRTAAAMMLPRFDLDEHQIRTIARNDVDFAEASAVAARKNCVPSALQRTDGQGFSTFAESKVRGSSHGRVGVQRAYRRS
jgi:hypothetical protein